MTVEEDVTAAGREFHQVTTHLLEPNRQLKSEVIEGDAKGTIVVITLEPETSGRTKVSVDADLKLGKMGSMLGVFAMAKIKEGLEHMINDIAKIMNSG